MIADNAADSRRPFLASHPWITFKLDVSKMGWRFWEQLGEARSKCRHLANTPLPPLVGQALSALYLAKGARATTAIEGNTLSELQALEAVRGQLKLPLGQEYLGREIENILAACGAIERSVYVEGDRFLITPELLKDLNRQVLHGLDVDDYVVPGEFRRRPVAVGGVYLGAPHDDCEFLVAQLSAWLNEPDFWDAGDAVNGFVRAVLRAALAHVYIAWIHPFGDGNGRTARLIEFGILTAAGIPSVSAHLLSNHYNATRSAYYRQLDYASKSGGRLDRFLAYAVEGFVGELQQQLEQVHTWNFQAAWTNYVHETSDPATTVTARRQRRVVLALPAAESVPISSIPTLTTELARDYAGKGRKTVSRDINALLQRGLIVRSGSEVRARREVMLGFLPNLPHETVI